MVRKQLATRKPTAILSGRPGTASTKVKLVKAKAETGAGKRKSSKPTKKMLHRREMLQKRQAKEIRKEQERATNRTAISRVAIKRIVRDILQDYPVIEEDGSSGGARSIASKAVNMLHLLAEEKFVTLANEASFLLEFAKKSTLTKEALETIRKMQMAREGKPVFELPPRDAPVETDPAAEEILVEENAVSESD